MDDHELLQRYLRNRSQNAFQEVVERHIGMVYAAARRMVGDTHLAEEVVQNVFTALAHKAASVRPPQVIGGWLYNTTRHLSMHTVRPEQRRRERENKAAAMQAFETHSAPDGIAD
jgi:RNA polymerase sigma factor (sigma-70 family)